MSETNFAGLTSKQMTAWAMDTWSMARDAMFINKFVGKSENSMIQLITELTKTKKGASAIIQLVADLVGDGVVGDNEREGNEEEIVNHDQEVFIDLISHGNKNKGKLSDQKSCINFRKTSKNVLAYWLADRLDQLAFLTMSGVSYAYTCNGALRTNGSQFSTLDFASQVSAPSSNRHVNWNGSSFESGNTASITTSYLPNYKMLVQATAFAKDHHIKPLKKGGKDYYVVLCRPGTIAQLKQDDDYLKAVVTALPRSLNNPVFTGGTVTIDGLVLHEHNKVYNTTMAASGAKWGASGTVDGTRTLVCGQQALAFCKIGNPGWAEKDFQYKSQQGINVDQMMGFLKPQFPSIYESDITQDEDFGLFAIDHYLPFQ